MTKKTVGAPTHQPHKQRETSGLQVKKTGFETDFKNSEFFKIGSVFFKLVHIGRIFSKIFRFVLSADWTGLEQIRIFL